MSLMAGSKRTVIISHPDFDKPGKLGVVEAKNFAETLLAGQKGMIEHAEQSGESLDKILQVKQHAKAYRIVIRNIDEEIF